MSKSEYKKYFVTGLLVLLPVMLTVVVIEIFVRFLFGTISSLFPFLPEMAYDLEIIITILSLIMLTFLIGFLVNKYFKNKLQLFLDSVFLRIPLVRFLYSSTRQVTEAMLLSNKSLFKRVVLVPFPGHDVYSIGFVTQEKLSFRKDSMAVFMPQSPLPSSGILAIVKKSKCVDLDISIEDAIKLIISSGVIEHKTAQD